MSNEERNNPDLPDAEFGDATVGIRLKILRKRQGLSIEDVFEETHISISNLDAIENENYTLLPADTFVRGLVALYADFLGIDGQEAARDFLQERERQKPRGKKNRNSASHSLRPKKLAEPSHVSSATVAVILLILIVASFSAFCVYNGWNPFSSFLEKKEATPPPFGQVLPGPTPTAPSDTTGSQDH